MTTPPDQLEDLYDHEVANIIRVREALRQRYSGEMRNYGAFESEARNRFAEAGFTIAITWYEYEIDGRKQEGALPEITITGRAEKRDQFDQDRQVHEVTSNILGIPGETGVIRTDPATLKDFLRQQDHGHHH